MKHRKARKAQFGPISSGTMRPEDLIPAFAGELDWQGGCSRRERALIREANKLTDFDSEEADGILSGLFDALDARSPSYGYFGANECDGADYGYWLFSIALEDSDALRVSDLAEVPRDYVGEILLTNNHGNLTLYCKRTPRGMFREVWAVV